VLKKSTVANLVCIVLLLIKTPNNEKMEQKKKAQRATQ